MFAKLQHRLDPPTALPCSLLSASNRFPQHSNLQPLDFPTFFGLSFLFSHSCALSCSFLHFQKSQLFCLQSFPHSASKNHAGARRVPPTCLARNAQNPVAHLLFFSTTYKMQISQPLSFDIHANWWGGVYPPHLYEISSPYLLQPITYPLYFHTLAHSSAPREIISPFLSRTSALFAQNTRGGGAASTARSALRGGGGSLMLTSHSPFQRSLPRGQSRSRSGLSERRPPRPGRRAHSISFLCLPIGGPRLFGAEDPGPVGTFNFEPSHPLPFSLLPHLCERAWTKGHGLVYRSYVAESTRGASPLRGAS